MLFFPPTRYEVRRELERNQRLSPERLEVLQWRKLKRLLRYAYANVPYYRKLFREADLMPDSIRDLEDFRRLPILRKEDIRRNFADMFVQETDVENLPLDSTGGSTGQPLNFYHDPLCKRYKNAAFRRFRRWMGVKSEYKTAFIWGAVKDVPQRPADNERWLDAFKCSPEEIAAFVKEMSEWKPEVVRAYVSSLYLAASMIKNRSFESFRPEIIETGAEKLWPHQRELIEEVFDCPVFEQYGSRETPVIACECENHRGMHLFSDIRLVEIIRNGAPAPPGEEGSIVITDLTNYTMPFIRYEIGDIGVISDRLCPCGRSFPLLEEVKGRTMDIFTTPRGEYVYGGYFNHFFFGASGVAAFQVRQKSLDRVEVSIEPAEDFEPDTMTPILNKMRETLGSEVQIEWKTVDEIPAGPSGKRHFTISEIPVDLAGAQADNRGRDE